MYLPPMTVVSLATTPLSLYMDRRKKQNKEEGGQKLGLATVVVMHVLPKNRLGHIPSICFPINFLFPLVVHDGLSWIFPFAFVLELMVMDIVGLSYVGFVNNKISLYR